MSVFVGVSPALVKQVFSATVEVHAEFVPHLHVAEVQILTNVAAHMAALPHIQVPASQLSESPVQLITLHGSEIN